MTLFFKIIASLTPLLVTVLGFSVGAIQMTQALNSDMQRANHIFNSGLQGSYFVLQGRVSELSEIDFDRAPDATGVVSALDHAKSDTPFWEGGPTDNFAARYTGALQVETAGSYTFYLTSDDGSALSLDGARVIDNDGAHGARTHEVTLDLAAGAHALEVLYFERGGAQTLDLDWQGPDTGGARRTVDGAALAQYASTHTKADSEGSPIDTATVDSSAAGLSADYFVLQGRVSELSEIDFDRAPDATGVVSALDHAKSDTPFWEGGPTDNFAARYTGALQVETAGSYTFYLTSDDGSALSLDGARVIDNDGAHGARTHEVTLDLAAGAHALEVLYFERGGAQTLELDWQGPDTGGARRTIEGAALAHDAEPADSAVAGLSADYFVLPNGVSELSEIDFDRAPDATDVVSALDHAKSDTPFWEGGPTDNFAARYTGALQVETAGSYTFYLTSDDGSALSLDGARVIDNDGAHGARTHEVTLDLAAGAHALEVLYFERGGAQTLELDWQGPDTGGARRTIEGAALAHDAEPADAATELSVAGQSHALLDQAAGRQGTAMHSLTADGSAVTLTDNGWKAVDGRFEITADTVLSFTFAADVIGEIHGIGFANGDGLAPETFFKLAGTQPWGLESDAWRYAPGSGAVEISIPVGAHFTGSFDRIVLGMDDDAEIGADSTFADIDIGPADPAASRDPSLNFTFTTDGPSGSGAWQDTDASGDVTPGDVLSYTYRLDNDGDVALTDVTLSGTRSGTSAADISAGILSGLTDTDGDGQADDLAAGATATATRSHTVTADDGGTTLAFTATAAAAETAAQSATLSVEIADAQPVNTAPEVVDDVFATRPGTMLAIDSADLLANDVDADGDALSLVDVRAVSGGSVSRDGDTIRFTPAPGFEGTATFDYSVSDGTASATATASVEVAATGYAHSLLDSVSDGTGLADPSLAVGLGGFKYWTSPPFLNLMKQATLPQTFNSDGPKVEGQESRRGIFIKMDIP